MKNLTLISAATIFISLTSCSQPAKISATPEKNYFSEVKGCFLLYNMNTKTFDKVLGEESCKEQLPACSTFKVPLAVMAFDSGVLKNEDVVLKWDGKKDIRPEANRDHNAKTWMRDSVVWFSQRLTPKMGKAKVQKYLNDFNYGNKDLRGGLTQAWLVAPSAKTPALKISAYQQVEFMEQLWNDTLPASPPSKAMTRKITFLEKSPKGYDLSGKTGSNFYDKERKLHLGWFISHLQKGEQQYIAVTHISDIKPTDLPGYGGPRAKALTKEILNDLALW